MKKFFLILLILLTSLSVQAQSTPVFPIILSMNGFSTTQVQELYIGTYPKDLIVENRPEIQGFLITTSPLQTEGLKLSIRKDASGVFQIVLYPEDQNLNNLYWRNTEEVCHS